MEGRLLVRECYIIFPSFSLQQLVVPHILVHPLRAKLLLAQPWGRRGLSWDSLSLSWDSLIRPLLSKVIPVHSLLP